MPGEYSHKHPFRIHHGPQADSRDSNWEEDAKRLEERNQERQESPMRSLPENFTSIDTPHGRVKSQEASADLTDMLKGGDQIKVD